MNWHGHCCSRAEEVIAVRDRIPHGSGEDKDGAHDAYVGRVARSPDRPDQLVET
jgi:hypothetical protein